MHLWVCHTAHKPTPATYLATSKKFQISKQIIAFMYMAKLPCCIKRRRAKKTYILGALLGALVAIAVVAGIAVSLAPAHISFAVANGTMIAAPPEEENKTNEATNYYNITVVAKNASPRTQVQYGSLSVQIWFSPSDWVPGEANLTAGEQAAGWQPGYETCFPISTKSSGYNNVIGDDEQREDSEKGGISISRHSCQVLVEAKVWFRVGRLSTRQYTIRASCNSVDFQSSANSTSPILCT